MSFGKTVYQNKRDRQAEKIRRLSRAVDALSQARDRQLVEIAQLHAKLRDADRRIGGEVYLRLVAERQKLELIEKKAQAEIVHSQAERRLIQTRIDDQLAFNRAMCPNAPAEHDSRPA